MRDAAARMVAGVAIAGIFAGSLQTAAQDTPGPAWKRALSIRSEGLNRLHQLGEFEPAWQRALRIRREQLNRR